MKRILFLLLLVSLLSACMPTTLAPAAKTTAALTDSPILGLSLATATAIPSGTPLPATVAPTALLAQTPTASPPRVSARVVRVVDGDTIDVAIGGKTYRVRYIGMDTPETVAPETPVQWMGPEATAANKPLVENKSVSLEKDVSETDRYGRLLRYVYVGDVFVNAELVRQGYAQVSTYPPDVKYEALFLQMQREAREAERGLWRPTPPNPPVTKATPTFTKLAATRVAPTSTRASTAPASTTVQELVSLTSPIRHGANATITVRTSPGVNCSITVYYKSGASTAQGLVPKTAGSDGICSWTWMVGTRTTAGTWRIVVTTGATTRE